MKKSLNCFVLLASLLLTGCTKEGDTIYQPNPNEEQPATTPFVTVIYGPNGLGDRSYNDLIYKGIEMAAKQYGLRTLQLAPESEAQGLAYLETMFRQMESASDTVRRLFITPSPVYDDFIRKNNKRLEANPYADLLYMETTTPLEGKGSTFYIDYYGAMYMGGCMAQYCSNFLLSLMVQFVPPKEDPGFPKISREEYDMLLDLVDRLGIDGFVQEQDDNEILWIPDFRRDRPFPEGFADPLPYFLGLKKDGCR